MSEYFLRVQQRTEPLILLKGCRSAVWVSEKNEGRKEKTPAKYRGLPDIHRTALINENIRIHTMQYERNLELTWS